MENTNTEIKKSGFTLVELMITIFISSLLTVAFYGTYILQRTSYAAQGQVTEMQQNIRAAIDTMMLDLRLAGYDPEGKNVGGVTVAQTNGISFTADLDEDGVIGTPAIDLEHFSYDVTGMTIRRSATLDVAPSFQPLADNIESIEYAYVLDDGTVKTPVTDPNEITRIAAIRVSILARSKNEDSKYTRTTPYTSAMGQVMYDPGSTDPANPSPHFRRRLLITNIDLRNMGL